MTGSKNVIITQFVCQCMQLGFSFGIIATYMHMQCMIILLQRKIIFRQSFFLYSPCPNLEGMETRRVTSSDR
jgi:hypothetical protein